MPKKLKSRAGPAPPAKVIPGSNKSVPDTEDFQDVEDPRSKNARAKALIMSTLEPGSEPWRIAEPLDSAAEIWKALEAKYAPRSTYTRRGEESPHVDGHSQNDKTVKELDSTADGAKPRSLSSEAQRRQEAQVRATKEFHESMPDQNQRLLWALLHGGKPETDAWFNGTDMTTQDTF